MTPLTTSLPESDRLPPVPSEALEALAGSLRLDLPDPSVLVGSLVHRSWCAENPGYDSNERLEFLGDAVLGMAVTDHSYRAYPGASEGELTDVRKAVVNAVTLAEVADELGLGTYLLLGKGEEQSGGREKPSILADALEAVIGVIYLTSGMPAAQSLVVQLLGSRLDEAYAGGPGGQDYKSRLQELAARQFGGVPAYMTDAEGPDHARRFHVTVVVGGSTRGQGDGRSKKQAEQVAARAAYETLMAELEEQDA